MGLSLSLTSDPQFADKALINQLALLLLERSDSLYQVPGYEARVHRWVLPVCRPGVTGLLALAVTASTFHFLSGCHSTATPSVTPSSS